MKKTVLYILFCLPFVVHAQNLSIDEMWNLLSTSNSARQNQLELEIANKNLSIEKTSRYPVIYGDANLQYNMIVPTTPVPAIAFDPTAPEGTFLPLRFATKWNMKAGLQLEWKFYDPTRNVKVGEKKILAEKSVIQQEQNAQNLKKDATLAYTSIVLSTLQHQAAIEDSIRYAEILQITTARYELGRETSEQYLLALQEFERKKLQLYETWSVLVDADLDLQKYIDLNNTKQLTSSIENILNALQSYRSKNFDTELSNIDIRLNNNDRKAFKSQLIPSLTFNAYIGGQFFNNEFRLFNGDYWFGVSYANVALRVPLSVLLTQIPSIKKLNAQRELYQLKLAETNKLDQIQHQQKEQKRAAAEQKVKALDKIVQLAQESIQKQKTEYEAGRILLSDYNRSLSNYNATQKELWQAQYDLVSIYLE